MIKNYLSLVKFSHTIFALPFALIGYTYAITQTDAQFSWISLLFVLLCMIFGRNAAMAFNRWADANIDRNNPRTSKREIPAGVVKSKSALLFVILNCTAFLITTYFINSLCFMLAPFVLAIILGYSYTKRFTSLCHFILGLGLAIAPLGAFLSVSPQWNTTIILFSLLVLTWVSGFDIIYALQDEDFDKSQKLYSIPTLLGKKGALILSTIVHFVSAVILILIGLQEQFSWFYWIGAILFICLLVFQHLLVKPNDLSRVNLAFFTTNGIASVVFAAFVILDLVFMS